MTAELSAALGYASRGWPVFAYHWQGEWRKCPLIERGLLAATRDEAVIRSWWRRWPNALIGVPTGTANGFIVLDVDVKRRDANGLDTLADLAFAALPDTPLPHTASGGLHLYFDLPKHREISNTIGDRGRGIGRGLDWRGMGGYVVVPSPNDGYHWDPHWNLDTAALAPVPAALLPLEPERRAAAVPPARPTAGLSPLCRGRSGRCLPPHQPRGR